MASNNAYTLLVEAWLYIFKLHFFIAAIMYMLKKTV
jgi:hypothetical protein